MPFSLPPHSTRKLLVGGCPSCYYKLKNKNKQGAGHSESRNRIFTSLGPGTVLLGLVTEWYESIWEKPKKLREETPGEVERKSHKMKAHTRRRLRRKFLQRNRSCSLASLHMRRPLFECSKNWRQSQFWWEPCSRKNAGQDLGLSHLRGEASPRGKQGKLSLSSLQLPKKPRMK